MDEVDTEVLTTGAVLRHRRPELFTKLDALPNAHEELLAASERDETELDRVRSEIQHQRNLIRIEEDLLITQARVVCCTLARLVTAKNMSELPPLDLVVLDEASMSSIPFAALAAMHARTTVVYAGDFRQLPPIVQAETKIAEKWLGRDVFDHAGITAQARSGVISEQRMVMLRTQYRMHPEIAKPVSHAFYGGLLRTDSDVADQVEGIGNESPFSGRRVVLVDVKNLGGHCQSQLNEPIGKRSRFNVVSALVSLTLARECQKNRIVGVITPYRAQAQLIGAMAHDVKLKERLISTVHRFQGGEVDVAVLDLVAAKGLANLGPLLGGDPWETAGRLLNVATSRPRGKLIIVYDSQYLAQKRAALGAEADRVALFRLLDQITALGAHKVVMTLDDFRTRLAEMPSCSLAGYGHVMSAELLPTQMYESAGAVRIAAAMRQLFLNVDRSATLRPWVKRSLDDYHADFHARGEPTHASWQAAYVPTWRMGPQTQVSLSVFVADGLRVGVDLRDQPGCIIIHMVETARFLANAFRLHPDNGRMVRPVVVD